ncbi:pyridoxal phosphate-dependent transferase [Jimgerdemannia flammicorona]|uniref:Pyridoxal phosphate-dependent transferase n=1 Tax=Jimgerdemannia flammicorona TaxID=994334 RepID=A0A433D4H0_9FUNG|nr:pyridoxal phosphate-dependent transferase [Jimgerdemannia flammicorona]
MALALPPPTQLGSAIPPHVPHAVSVTLPTWKDNVDYEEGVARVHDAMVCGYPRFFIHPEIKKVFSIPIVLLATWCEKKFAKPTESCMLFPSRSVAERCRAFIKRYYKPESDLPAPRLAEFNILPPNPADPHTPPAQLHIVLYPADALPVAKQFWQHVGDNVSSRFAEYCLRILEANERSANPDGSQNDTTTTTTKDPAENPPSTPKRNLRYYQRPPSTPTVPTITPTSRRVSVSSSPRHDDEPTDHEHTLYVEERYGRNLGLAFADGVKTALRRRIAGVWAEEAGAGNLSERGVGGVSEEDVYLFPCGMSAIFNAHRYIMAATEAEEGPVAATWKSVYRAILVWFLGISPIRAFYQSHPPPLSFPYTDTLKILQKFGPGCHHLGHGDARSVAELEQLLGSGERVLVLFVEFPSNPLLKSSDLHRLRELANAYNFFIAIDETLGCFVNVSVLEHADIVVSSLTKIFSGDSNVMGGSLVLNPNGRHCASLRRVIKDDYEDLLWCGDAIYLERNSRTFRERIAKVDRNAEVLCDYLKAHEKGV